LLPWARASPEASAQTPHAAIASHTLAPNPGLTGCSRILIDSYFRLSDEVLAVKGILIRSAPDQPNQTRSHQRRHNHPGSDSSQPFRPLTAHSRTSRSV
jgi:hypothetical protein